MREKDFIPVYDLPIREVKREIPLEGDLFGEGMKANVSFQSFRDKRVEFTVKVFSGFNFLSGRKVDIDPFASDEEIEKKAWEIALDIEDFVLSQDNSDFLE